MGKLTSLCEVILKHTADQTITINPNAKEIKDAYNMSTRGTVIWDLLESGNWFLSDSDVVHNTLSVAIPILHDTVNFYIYPNDKIMSLGYNQVDAYKNSKLGSYIPYEEISKNSYWKLLQDSGWKLRDVSGEFGEKGLNSRIKSHPLDELKKKENTISKLDTDILDQLGVKLNLKL